MKKYSFEWVQDWCQENGWTDLFMERREYWAFPPHAVIPVPVPTQALQMIKAEKGLSPDEKWWYGAACLSAGISALLSYALNCPMPLVAAFAFCAYVVAQAEDE